MPNTVKWPHEMTDVELADALEQELAEPDFDDVERLQALVSEAAQRLLRRQQRP
jgi:hypothetical protein